MAEGSTNSQDAVEQAQKKQQQISQDIQHTTQLREQNINGKTIKYYETPTGQRLFTGRQLSSYIKGKQQELAGAKAEEAQARVAAGQISERDAEIITQNARRGASSGAAAEQQVRARTQPTTEQRKAGAPSAAEQAKQAQTGANVANPVNERTAQGERGKIKVDDRDYRQESIQKGQKYGGIRPSSLKGSVVAEDRAIARQTGTQKFTQKAETALGKGETAFQRAEKKREIARQVGAEASSKFFEKYQIGAKKEQRASVRARQGVTSSSLKGSTTTPEYAKEWKRKKEADQLKPTVQPKKSTLSDYNYDVGDYLYAKTEEEVKSVWRGLTKAGEIQIKYPISDLLTKQQSRKEFWKEVQDTDVIEAGKATLTIAGGWAGRAGLFITGLANTKIFEGVQELGKKTANSRTDFIAKGGWFASSEPENFTSQVENYATNNKELKGVLKNVTNEYKYQANDSIVQFGKHNDTYTSKLINFFKETGYNVAGAGLILVGSALEKPLEFYLTGKVAEGVQLLAFRGGIRGLNILAPSIAEKPAVQLGVYKFLGGATDVGFVGYSAYSAPEGQKGLAAFETGTSLLLFKGAFKAKEKIARFAGYNTVTAQAESLPKEQRTAFDAYLKEVKKAGKAEPQKDQLDLSPTFVKEGASTSDLLRQQTAARVTKEYLIGNKRDILGGSAGQNPHALPEYKKPNPADVDIFTKNYRKSGAEYEAKLKEAGVQYTVKYSEPVNPVKKLGGQTVYEFLEGAHQAIQKRGVKFNVEGTKVEMHDITWKEAFAYSEKPILTVEGVQTLSLREQSYRKLVGAYLAGRANKDIPDFKRVMRSQFVSQIKQAENERIVNFLAEKIRNPELADIGTPSKLAKSIPYERSIMLDIQNAKNYFTGATIYGFYSPKTDSITLARGIRFYSDLAEGAKPTLIHEMTHKLDIFLEKGNNKFYGQVREDFFNLSPKKYIEHDKIINEAYPKFQRGAEYLARFAQENPQEIFTPTTRTGKYLNKQFSKAVESGELKVNLGVQQNILRYGLDLAKRKQLAKAEQYAKFVEVEKKNLPVDIMIARKAFAGHAQAGEKFEDIAVKIKPEKLVTPLKEARKANVNKEPEVIMLSRREMGKRGQFGLPVMRIEELPSQPKEVKRAGKMIEKPSIMTGKPEKVYKPETVLMSRRSMPYLTEKRGVKSEKGYAPQDYAPEHYTRYGNKGYSTKGGYAASQKQYLQEDYIPQKLTNYGSRGYLKQKYDLLNSKPQNYKSKGRTNNYAGLPYMQQGGYPSTPLIPTEPPKKKKVTGLLLPELDARDRSRKLKFGLPKSRYTPTVYSLVLDVEAPASSVKQKGLTGLEVRPILKRKKRRGLLI